jgi:hypothetical protein
MDKAAQRFCKKVGLKIRFERESRNWTLEFTEEKGYPNWRHWQRVEAGNPCSLLTIYEIARILKVKPNTLLDI